MVNNQIKIFDEKGNLGIAVYRARKYGTTEWKLLYMWVDYNRVMYVDCQSGELVPKGYYLYVYFGDKIAGMFSYDPNGAIGQIFLGEAKKKKRDEFERHASLVTYWGEEVLKELFEDIEVDFSQGVNIRFFNPHQGDVFPNWFIMEHFPIYTFKPFWKPEKWDRLPEDTEF